MERRCADQGTLIQLATVQSVLLQEDALPRMATVTTHMSVSVMLGMEETSVVKT